MLSVELGPRRNDSLATVKQRESLRFPVARTDLRAFHFLHIASRGRNGLENRRVFVLELQIQRVRAIT